MSPAGYWHCDVLLPDGWHRVRWEGRSLALTAAVLDCEIARAGAWEESVKLYTSKIVAATEPYFEPLAADG